MYEAPNPRPKKTAITRSRSGCAPCRRKRRKCDEEKPSCRRCLKASFPCHYEDVAIGFRDVSTWAARRVEIDRAASNSSARQRNQLATVAPLSPPQEMPSFETGTQEDLITGQSTIHNGNDAFLFGSPSFDGRVSFEGTSNLKMAQSDQLATCAATLSGLPPLDEGADHSLSSEPSEDVSWLDDALVSAHTPGSTSGSAGLCADFGMETGVAPSLDDTWAVDDVYMASIGDSRSWNSWIAAFPSSSHYPALLFNNCAGWADAPSSLLTPAQGKQSPKATGLRLPPRHDGFNGDVTSHHRALEMSIQPHPGATPSPSQTSESSSTLVRLANRRYMAHFTVEVMNNLPSQVNELWQWVMSLAPLRLAAMALGAANLANKHGMLSPGRQGRWVPMARHAREAAQYMSRCSEALHDQPPLALLPRIAFWILRVCYELETGSIHGMRHALAIMDDILSENREEILSSPVGKALVRNCLLLRCFEVVARKPHAPLGKESRSEALISEFQRHVATPEFLISTIGYRGCRLSWRILLVRCLRSCSESSTDTVRKMAQWWDVIMGGRMSSDALESDQTSNPVLDEEELYAELESLRSDLSTCKAPKGMPSSTEECRKVQAGQQVSPQARPLRFENHQHAMLCANYCLARLVCDADLLRRLTAEPPASSSSGTISVDPAPLSKSPWFALLLRIAYGLDPRDCQRYNAYQAGIISMLQCVFFLGAGRDAIDCMDDFLRRAASAGVQYEGPFSPMEACWKVNRVLCRQTRSHPGRVIFMAFGTYDPASKAPLFSRAALEYLLICGREPNGAYFNDIVSMVEDEEEDGEDED